MVETMDAVLMKTRLPMGRRQMAAERLLQGTLALAVCEICHHRCGANRLEGPAGRCGAAAEPNVFSAQIEVGDEHEIIPAYAIALAGCNMRCAFCITGDESWHPRRGHRLDAADVAGRASAAIGKGQADSLLVLGGEPTIHLPWLLELVAAMPEKARLVLKTNGLSTSAVRAVLDGLFDVWIVDFKFGNDACAEKLSLTRGYTGAVGETLLWAASHTDLIIRHLLMPGHVDCCWRPAAEWISIHLPGAKVSLRSGYWPTWRAADHVPLDRPLDAAELSEAMAVATHLKLHLVP
ncbi:radical SAM protein [Luteolibacter yonseiensis]|uniref:Radical SAM protein n=1 Tax=Luteolibacter yonseiensis TaxID=1144680 RepID=A0A934R133_9BACT|nr:radical SAM protein [Luteolibacter yonseiensis]MBK1814961.1 radical SAM protein [Luteolibacter yonseiensis]